MSDATVEMPWAIADSTETIVRFEGDDYSHGITMFAGDKQAIQNALTADEVLQ